jgi:uncharacterized protein
VIASPCVKVCVMDPDDRYCLGCRRTLGEIARWSQMTDAERVAVMAQLPARPAEGGAASAQAA